MHVGGVDSIVHTQCFCTYSSRLPVFKRAYSREFLLDVGRTTLLELNPTHAEELRDLGLLRRPTPSPTPTTASRPERRRYKRRERKQKRGKQKCSCGSVVEHCVSSAKGCGFDSQGTHILIKHV